MTESRTAALEYAHKNQSHFIDTLKAFVSIPSISTDPSAKPDIQRAAEWVADQLRGLGMENVQILPTAMHPIVYGECLRAGREKPTVLIYGHYDVQPPDPLELWETPPFQPVVRGDNLFGRGASDMKGQVMICLKAIEAITCTGSLPVNVKFIIEGEEEIGSPSLNAFIATHKNLLISDFLLNTDTGMIGAEYPTITYGLRGLAYFDVIIYGPQRDLHSGLYGGTIHNPAQVLCELIAGMHDQQGRVTLPGFYDSVRPLTVQERAELARLPLDEDFYLSQTGVSQLYGEAGYSPVERVGARPTLEVNGLLSGWTGEGSKTVLPAKAMAKVSMRLVPDQDPNEVERQLIHYLEAHTPPTVHWELKKHAGGPPAITNLEIPPVIALRKALEAVWGKPPLIRREGGSVPIVASMQKILAIESVLTGFGLPDDNMHSPNEKVHLPTFFRGIDTIIHFLNNL